MERNLLLFILILFAINARGQNSYYETDTSFTTGARIIPGKNNSDFFRCQIYSNGKYTDLLPLPGQTVRIRRRNRVFCKGY